MNANPAASQADGIVGAIIQLGRARRLKISLEQKSGSGIYVQLNLPPIEIARPG